jgi:acyl-CoA synthetase (AMP-forming)/AMP-acid ligase II
MLSAYKRPRAYRFVDTLPMNATGKKLHYKAAEQAATEYPAGLFESP